MNADQTPSSSSERSSSANDRRAELENSAQGKMLGQYLLESELSGGESGVLYRAIDTQLQRPAAVKLLAPELAGQPPRRAPFMRAARELAKIQHANVISIYEVSEDTDRAWVAMEWIAGSTLHAWVGSGKRLITREVVRLGIQIAQGLEALHQAGLVHGQLRPEKVLLVRGEDGLWQAKLNCLGASVVEQVADSTGQSSMRDRSSLSSPEVTSGQAVSAGSDVYLLGSVLYWMCTGRSPFEGEHSSELRQMPEKMPLPIEQLNPNIPLALIGLIEQMMAKTARSRPASAGEVATRLAKLLSSGSLAAISDLGDGGLSDAEEVEDVWQTKSRQLIIGLVILVVMLVIPLIWYNLFAPKKPKKAGRLDPAGVVAPDLPANVDRMP